MVGVQNIFGAHRKVMGRWMVFCKVIGVIVFAFVPVNTELFLCGFIAEPVPSHVQGLGTSLLDIGVDETVGSGIVGFEGGSRLRMTQRL